MAKPFLGVVHLPKTTGGIECCIESALRDAKALHQGGVDGIIVENLGDAPFHKGTRDDPVPPHVPAVLAVVGREVRNMTGLPIGINCLRNDAVAALGAALAAGATWVRVNVFAGAYVTDQGLIEAEAARVLDYRARMGLDVQIVADHMVKHAAPLALSDPVVAAADLAERSGADVMILSGDRTGHRVDVAFLREVREAVAEFPVWIGSGLSAANAHELWPLCDGAIVGTSLKVDGIVSQPVDKRRVAELRRLLR